VECIKQKELEWLFKHSFYPTFTHDPKGRRRYRFGNLPWRKTIKQAIKDAMKSEERK
jgi:hypothetical protein